MENKEEILYKHIEWIFASDKEKESFLNAMSEHSDQQNKALLEEIERLKGEKEDLKSKLLLSEQNVKLNYNMLLDADNSITAYRANIEQLQIELKAADSVNEGLFTLDDMKKACGVGVDICCKHNPETGNDFKPFEDLINQLKPNQPK